MSATELIPSITEHPGLVDGQNYNIGDDFDGGVVVKVLDKSIYTATIKVCHSRSEANCGKCMFSTTCGASDAEESPYLYGLGDISET